MRKADHDFTNARRLRREQSLPEGLIWRELRGKRTSLKFRRQHPIGPYVLDFYCAQAKLGIEIDGIGHDMGDRPEADERRDRFLRDYGIEIVRIAAADVLADPNAIAKSIVAHCRERME